MTRIDEHSLALHFEVALTGVAPQLIADLAEGDRFRRRTAVSMLAHHLAERMSGFEIVSLDVPHNPGPMPLFPELNGGSQ